MNRLKTLLFLSLRIFSFGRKGEKLSRPLLGSILGICLSLIPLVVVIQISGGMIHGITERFLETLSYHLQTFPYMGTSIDQLKETSSHIESLDYVRNSTVERQGFGLIYASEGKSGVTIRAVEEDFYDSDIGVRQYLKMESGKFNLANEQSAMIGRDIARKLKLQIGDEIKILTGRYFNNGKFLPKISRYKIEGVFSTGYDELDKMWVFIPLSSGKKILAENSSQTIIGIKTKDPYNTLKNDMLAIRKFLPQRWGMYTWKNLNRAQQENYQTTRMLLIFIMGLIVCVAIINISSSLIMLVLERQVELSILKCLGASPSDITLSYIFTGFFTGFVGSISGLTLGLIISININQIISGIDTILNFFSSLFRSILSPLLGLDAEPLQLLNSSYYLDNIPISIQASDIITIFILTTLLSTLSATIPAIKAGKIKPMSIMRKH